MTPQELRKLLQILADKIKEEVRKRMEDKGYNERAQKNTLVGSDLYKSVKAQADGDGLIVFQLADYFQYVVQGRKAGWKNRPPKPPGIIHGITQWVRKHNIRLGNMSENQTIWAVLESLEIRDIKARPFINYVENGDASDILPFLDKFFDDWADMAFDEITKQLDEYFK